jgi:hypothetical protein
MLPRAGFRQISLYFSLLTGNLGRRLVRFGLRRQPASSVSMGHLRFERKTVTVPALSVSPIGLRSGKILHLWVLERNFRASLRSRVFNIRFLKAETKFESPEIGSIRVIVNLRVNSHRSSLISTFSPFVPVLNRKGNWKMSKQRAVFVSLSRNATK